MTLEGLTDHIAGAQIVSLDMDEESEVFTIYLSNGMCLYLVGGLGLSLADKGKLH